MKCNFVLVPSWTLMNDSLPFFATRFEKIGGSYVVA